MDSREKQIEECTAQLMYEQAEKSGHAMSSIARTDMLIAQAKKDVAREIFEEIESACFVLVTGYQSFNCIREGALDRLKNKYICEDRYTDSKECDTFGRKLTEEERKLLGEKGVCEVCGAEGTYCIDPYAEEIYGNEILSCYCDDCYEESCRAI